MYTTTPKSLPLFGGQRAWRQEDFTSSDDRVRGGSSQSYLSPSADLSSARFHGILDTTTLGGAGFASQRTTANDKIWNLSAYRGIELIVANGDGKKYTLNIKTTIPEKMPNGRDASTVEYAYTFIAPPKGARIYAEWAQFEPYYRGKPVTDAKPLDLSHIMRWSIMMRSFFEMQSGPFSMVLNSIKARSGPFSHNEKESDIADDEQDSDWDDCSVDDSQSKIKGEKGSESKGKGLKFCAIL